jgi:geranylgeranyl pyrophosphate synthase
MEKVLDNGVLMSGVVALPLFECWREEVDAGLSSLAVELTRDSALLREATVYVLQGAGKKLRSLLILSIVQDIFGAEGDLSGALRCAIAVEAMHAASLVHDDLPALDNDDYRRGRLSCHRAVNEATAILVGDLLVGVAFSSVSMSSDAPEKRALVSKLLARTWTELCVGQQLDLQEVAVCDQRRRMIELKTGSLFGFAAASGAICAGLEETVVTRMFDWGVRVGVVFQKLDDVDDGECSRDEISAVGRENESLIEELHTYLGSSAEHTVTIVRRILDTQRTG